MGPRLKSRLKVGYRTCQGWILYSDIFLLANIPYFNFEINFQSSYLTKKETEDASKRLSSYCMGALLVLLNKTSTRCLGFYTDNTQYVILRERSKIDVRKKMFLFINLGKFFQRSFSYRFSASIMHQNICGMNVIRW